MNTRPLKRGYRATLENLPERFWSKVAKGDGCWEWIGVRVNRRGAYDYGLMKRTYGRPMVLAHRISYELHNGPIPPGLFICHHCDNPPCVNPAHLFLGTSGDNQRDMARKGRARGKPQSGESHPMAKLTALDVIEIRRRASSGTSTKTLASEYAMDRSHMWAVVTGRSWKSVGQTEAVA